MARLPQPGGDAGNWGEILNEYLAESIASDGTIKPSTVGSSQLKLGAVTSDKLSANNATDGQVLSYNSGSLAWISPASAGAIASDDITDATATGKSILKAANAAAVRTTIGAGTSNLAIGTTNSTAKAGDYQPTADDVTETTARKILTAAERTKLTGIATAATANASDAQLRDRSTHTGTQAATTITGLSAVATTGSADDIAESSTNKVLTATERTKLTGIATAATANASDTQLRDRSTHTGTQAATTITGLSTVATTGSYNDLSDKPSGSGDGTWGSITGTLASQTDLQSALDAKATKVNNLNQYQVMVRNISGTGEANAGHGYSSSATNSTLALRSGSGTLAVNNGTAATDAVNKSQLDTKADDNTVVKLTGDQTVAGIKTFNASPAVPVPTTWTQAAQKGYADDLRTEIPNKLAPFYAAASALRNTRPIIVAIAGASVAAQITSDRWTYQFNARLQATFPKSSGAEQPIITLSTANSTPPTGTGIVTVNAAVGGTTTANYLTSTTRPQLMNLHPSIIIHADMPANDYGSTSVTPAQVKANMITQLNALDSAAVAGYPYVHVVIGGYFPTISGAIAPIADFRQAMREAVEGRSNVVFIDTYDFFTSIGVGSGGSDPLGLLLDGLHPNANGHRVLADHVSRLFNLYPTTAAASNIPVVTTSAINSLVQGTAFSQTLAASGATPITWSVVSGTLPAGLSLAGSTGILSGTPSASGAYSFTVRATNSAGAGDKAFSGSVAGTEPTATIITSDNFTTDGAASGRTANAALGGSTASWLASGSIYATSGGSLVHNGTSSGALQIAHADSLELQVTATLTSWTTGTNTNIELYRKASGTCYLLGISATTGTLRLGRSDGITYQDYGTAPADFIGKRLRLRYYSGKVSAYLDGVLLSEHTDTSVSRTGSGSGFSRGAGTITATWDDFVLESLA